METYLIYWHCFPRYGT